MKRIIWTLALTVVFCGAAHAASQGGWSIGANLGFINADQKDFNSVIEQDEATTGASEFGNAWEVNGHISYRLSGAVALTLRPSYFFYGEEDGTGASYSLSGFTIFPGLKWYMLEDQTIKFYSQFGVGYGHLSGEIEVGNASVEFSGGDVGYLIGLGAEFCFGGGGHCINVEGGARFLSIDRFIADDGSGDLSASGITQNAKSQEVEINDRDFSATMSGILGMIGYTMYF